VSFDNAARLHKNMTQDNKKMLIKIAATSAPFRRSLANLAKRHSEEQCNGRYYFDDDKNAWVGYTGHPLYIHSTTSAEAKEGKKREAEIVKKLCLLTGKTKNTLPDFLSYAGDPRGFVLKINSDKLTEEEINLCVSLEFMRDWGGDFAITKDSEY
jgi:hypothetical protein